jgi:hypothetical protein
MSFYRLLFFSEAPGMVLPNRPVEHTVFAVACTTDRAIDLRAAPFDRDRHVWEHPTDYAGCQDVADAARSVDIQVIRYRSVRDPQRGGNCAILKVAAFAERRPKNEQTWHIFPGTYSVRAWCENPPLALEFRPDDFQNDPRIAAAQVTSSSVTASSRRE